jgi:hypothetical protein
MRSGRQASKLWAEQKKPRTWRGFLSLVASSSDPVVRCQLQPGSRIALNASATVPASRVITSIYLFRLKRLEL